MSTPTSPPPSWRPTSGAPTTAPSRRTALLVVAVGLAVLTIALATTLVVVLTGRDGDAPSATVAPSRSEQPSSATSTPVESTPSGPDSMGGDATLDADLAATQQAATQFLLRVNTYGPDDLAADGTMPGYRDRVLELVTARLAAQFVENVAIAEQSVAEAGVARVAEQFASGVSFLGEGRATVLVAGSITITYPDPPDGPDGRVESAPRPFRVVVDLERDGTGDWLVDDFVEAHSGGEGLGSGNAPGDRLEGAGRDATDAAAAAAPLVLGYDYRTLDEDEAAAGAVLTDDYRAEFARTFRVVRDSAPGQRLVVTAETRAAGVSSSPTPEGRVEVLVYVERDATSTRAPATYRDAVAFSMLLVDGTWLVDGIATS